MFRETCVIVIFSIAIILGSYVGEWSGEGNYEKSFNLAFDGLIVTYFYIVFNKSFMFEISKTPYNSD